MSFEDLRRRLKRRLGPSTAPQYHTWNHATEEVPVPCNEMPILMPDGSTSYAIVCSRPVRRNEPKGHEDCPLCHRPLPLGTTGEHLADDHGLVRG